MYGLPDKTIVSERSFYKPERDGPIPLTFEAAVQFLLLVANTPEPSEELIRAAERYRAFLGLSEGNA